jgi:hypothetical protein
MDAVALTGTLTACAVIIATVALSAWRIDAVSRRGGGADDYFWVGFGGVVVIAGAGVLVGASSGLGAVLALAVGLVSAGVATAWAWRRHTWRKTRAADAAWNALRRRHDAAVERWADYDVDPAKAIDYPGMHDPSNPAAQPILRALRAARLERDGVEQTADGRRESQRYTDAVCHLEHAVDAAEQVLGVQGPARPPVYERRRVDLESLPAGQLRRVSGS